MQTAPNGSTRSEPIRRSTRVSATTVDETTATLPNGWKQRLIGLPPGDTEGVKGLCLDPHDLAIAKYVARREKDLAFTRELARRGLLDHGRLLALLEQTPIDEVMRQRVRSDIGRDFDAAAAPRRPE